MKKALYYTCSIWGKIKNDNLSQGEIMVIAAIIMVVTFGVIYAINPNIISQY